MLTFLQVKCDDALYSLEIHNQAVSNRSSTFDILGQMVTFKLLLLMKPS